MPMAATIVSPTLVKKKYSFFSRNSLNSSDRYNEYKIFSKICDLLK